MGCLSADAATPSPGAATAWKNCNRMACGRPIGGVPHCARDRLPHAENLNRLRLIVTHTAPPLVPHSLMDLADTFGFYRREGRTLEIVHSCTAAERRKPPNNPLELTAHSAGLWGYSWRFLLWAAAQRERSGKRRDKPTQW